MSLDDESPGRYEPLDFTSPPRRGDWSSSVWWLFVPTVALLGFALWQRAEPRFRPVGFAEPDAPEDPGATSSIAGWSARVDGEGFELRMRLEPLHPTEARQAFDAAALADHFRAGGAQAIPGAQPWRLSLAAIAIDDAAASSSPIRDLSGARIVGLEPLVPPLASERTREGGVVDPLATLFSFPETPLRAGETCDLVFWGPRPADEVVVTAPGLSEPAVLRKRDRAASSSSAAIARLDARARLEAPPADRLKEDGR